METVREGKVLFLQLLKTATNLSFSLRVLCADVYSCDNKVKLGVRANLMLLVRHRSATVLHTGLLGNY